MHGDYLVILFIVPSFAAGTNITKKLKKTYTPSSKKVSYLPVSDSNLMVVDK